MTPAELAALLSRTGTIVEEADILQDIELGLPVGSDGKIEILIYTAWLARTERDARR